MHSRLKKVKHIAAERKAFLIPGVLFSRYWALFPRKNRDLAARPARLTWEIWQGAPAKANFAQGTDLPVGSATKRPALFAVSDTKHGIQLAGIPENTTVSCATSACQEKVCKRTQNSSLLHV